VFVGDGFDGIGIWRGVRKMRWIDGWANRDNLRGCVCRGVYISNDRIPRTRRLIHDTILEYLPVKLGVCTANTSSVRRIIT